MGTRTSHPPGTFSWVDLQTTDLDAAKRFYGELFGWQFEDMPAGDSVYSMVKVDGEYACAAGPLPADTDIPPHWNSYVTVESADETTGRVEGLGGKVIEQPFDVFTAGRMGLLTDPTGAYLAVWEPRDHIGAGIVNVPGALCWNELWTTDVDAAARFYGELFGWTAESVEAMGGCTMIRNGERGNGGIQKLTGDMAHVPPHWAVYFAVEDAGAASKRVEELGGRVLVPRTPLSDVGAFSAVADPVGAPFVLYEGMLED